MDRDHDRTRSRAGPPRAGMLTRLLDQFRQYAVMFLYLLILFGLFVLNERIVLDQHGLTFAASGFAVINALVLAKVMLVMEDLRPARFVERRPLVYVIVFEALLLTLFFLVFHVVERVAMSLWHGASLDRSLVTIGGGGWAGVICVSLILFISLLPYFAFKHLSRAIGIERVKTLLFRPPDEWTSGRAPGTGSRP